MEKFDKYVIYYYSGLNPAARIDLFKGKKNTKVGRILFFGTDKPSNTDPYEKSARNDNIPVAFFNITRFNDVINLLREEKPLFFNVYPNGIGCIGTSEYEPVGDEERK